MDIYLPIAEMSINAVLLIGLGTIVGFLSGLFGIGGGFLMTPFLTFLGIPPAIAVASQANQQIGTSVSGALAQWRKRNIDIQMALILMTGSLVGTKTGVEIFKWLKQIGQINLVIVIGYVTLLSTVGALMFWESAPRLFRRGIRDRSVPHVKAGAVPAEGALTQGWGANSIFAVNFPVSQLRVNVLLPLGMGFMAGILVSMFGVGGFVMVPSMIYILRMPPRLVNGTSLFQIIFTSSIATIMQSVSNHTVDIMLALFMLIGSVMGVPLGARLSARLSPEVARFLMAVLILGVAGMLLFELTFPPKQLFAVEVTLQ